MNHRVYIHEGVTAYAASTLGHDNEFYALVLDVKWSPDGTRIASAGRDATVQVLEPG